MMNGGQIYSSMSNPDMVSKKIEPLGLAVFLYLEKSEPQ
jgi:hypothetical protein